MSAKVTGMVFERYPEGGGEMLLALALADHAHDDGTSIFPSVDRLAAKTRQSRRAVQYQLRHMEECGWLILVNGGKGGRKPGADSKGRTREYRINPAWMNGAEIAPFSAVQSLDSKDANFAPLESEKGATEDKKGCKSEQERVQSETGKGATAIAPESSVNRHEPSVNRGAGAPAGHITNPMTGEVNPRPVQIAVLLRKTYSMPVTSNSAEVLEMTRLAVTDLEIAEHIDAFRVKKPGEQPNARYVLRMIESTRKAVADADAAPGVSGAAAVEIGVWWRSASGIEAKGVDLGVKRCSGEPEWVFKTRVFRDAGPGKWRDEWEAALLKSKNSAYAQVFEQFHGHPPVEVQA